VKDYVLYGSVSVSGLAANLAGCNTLCGFNVAELLYREVIAGVYALHG
jgi:hypothetical protein